MEIKIDVPLLHITTWMDLLTQNVEWRSQTQKVLIDSFHYEKFKIKQSTFVVIEERIAYINQ